MGKRKKTTETTQKSTTTPILSPQRSRLQDLLLGEFESRLAEDGLPAGFAETGLGEINQAFQAGEGRLAANLTSRGLSDSPIAGRAAGNLEASRSGGIGRFLASLPQLARQNRMADFAQGLALSSTMPLGSRTDASGRQVQTTSGGLGSLLGGLAAAALFAPLTGGASLFATGLGGLGIGKGSGGG